MSEHSAQYETLLLDLKKRLRESEERQLQIQSPRSDTDTVTLQQLQEENEEMTKEIMEAKQLNVTISKKFAESQKIVDRLTEANEFYRSSESTVEDRISKEDTIQASLMRMVTS